MSTATITSKGQITIPSSVREALGVDVGDRVHFVEIAPGLFEFSAATQSIRALKGILKSDLPILTIEEMNEIIAECGASSDSGARPSTE